MLWKYSLLQKLIIKKKGKKKKMKKRKGPMNYIKLFKKNNKDFSMYL